MAIESGISWTRSTFNPWIGCTKIGPGCDACYAEVTDKFRKFGGKGETHWGDDKERYRTSLANWKGPHRWNALAGLEVERGEIAVQEKGKVSKPWHTPGFWPVFCASLADVFDNRVPIQWRADLFWMIEATPNLSWLLVTKRIGNVKLMIPERWKVNGFPDHVRLLITVVNQEEADRDIPKLLALPCKNGISNEPAIGPIDWSPWLPVLGDSKYELLQWIITGGESRQPGYTPRPYPLSHARRTIAQCSAAGVPVFVKQLGAMPIDESGLWQSLPLTDRTAGSYLPEWPADLQIQEFPR